MSKRPVQSNQPPRPSRLITALIVGVPVLLLGLVLWLRNGGSEPPEGPTPGSVVYNTQNEAWAAVSSGVSLNAEESLRLAEAQAVIRSLLGSDHPVVRQFPNVQAQRHQRAVYVRVQGQPSVIHGSAAIRPPRMFLSPLLFSKSRTVLLCTTVIVEVEHTINKDFAALEDLPDGVEDDKLRSRMEVAPLFIALDFLDRLERSPRFDEWKSDIPTARRQIRNFMAALDDGIVTQWRRDYERNKK